MAEILKDILKSINKLEQKQDADQKKLNLQLQEIRQENKVFRDELNHTWYNFTQPLLYYNVGNAAASMYHNMDKDKCTIAEIRVMVNDCITKSKLRKKLGVDQNFYKDIRKCLDDTDMLENRTNIAHAGLSLCLQWLQQWKRVEKESFPPHLENMIKYIEQLITKQSQLDVNKQNKKRKTLDGS